MTVPKRFTHGKPPRGPDYGFIVCVVTLLIAAIGIVLSQL